MSIANRESIILENAIRVLPESCRDEYRGAGWLKLTTVADRTDADAESAVRNHILYLRRRDRRAASQVMECHDTRTTTANATDEAVQVREWILSLEQDDRLVAMLLLAGCSQREAAKVTAGGRPKLAITIKRLRDHWTKANAK